MQEDGQLLEQKFGQAIPLWKYLLRLDQPPCLTSSLVLTHIFICGYETMGKSIILPEYTYISN